VTGCKKEEPNVPIDSRHKRRAEAIRVASGKLLDVTKHRIFKQGKKTNFTPIGPYRSEPYKRKREARGLQTNYVDLVFTGRMRNDMVVGFTSTGAARCFFRTDEVSDIAGYQEEARGVIFKPTKREIALTRKWVADEMRKR
jgi:hypothetical protein